MKIKETFEFLYDVLYNLPEFKKNIPMFMALFTKLLSNKRKANVY